MMSNHKNKASKVYTSEDILEVVKSFYFTARESTLQQIEIILKIGGENKLPLIPFISYMIKEQSLLDYQWIAKCFCINLELSYRDTLFVYLRPDLKAFVDEGVNILDILDDDYSISQKIIDDNFETLTPKEIIALHFYIGEKGGSYCKLASGIKLVNMDEGEDYLFNMPELALEVLTQGLEGLSKDTSMTLFIRSSLQSFITEAHIKFLTAQYELDIKNEKTEVAIEWVTRNKPHSQRWMKLLKTRPDILTY